MLNLIIKYLLLVRYNERFNKKMIDTIDGFVSGLSDAIIIGLLVLYLTKPTIIV